MFGTFPFNLNLKLPAFNSNGELCIILEISYIIHVLGLNKSFMARSLINFGKFTNKLE